MERGGQKLSNLEAVTAPFCHQLIAFLSNGKCSWQLVEVAENSVLLG